MSTFVRHKLCIVFAFTALALSACGQRGPLYLPDETPIEVRQTPPPVTPAPAPAATPAPASPATPAPVPAPAENPAPEESKDTERKPEEKPR